MPKNSFERASVNAGAPFGVYIHIPFCSRICPYCDFVTTGTLTPPEQEYCAKVSEELKYQLSRPHFSDRVIRTIYFGGGTPSMFSAEALGGIVRTILQHATVAEDAEITMEANPGDVPEERLKGFQAKANINRISYGNQSFQPRILQLLGRTHTSADCEQAVTDARTAGIESINLDLIVGVPEQTQEELDADLASTLALAPEHVSVYSLTIEKGTPFFQRQQKGLLTIPEEGESLQFLQSVHEQLAQAGYSGYEVSNYCLPDQQSRHNSAYWDGVDYLGVGVGAHSYEVTFDNGVIKSALRRANTSSIKKYLKSSAEEAVGWRDPLDLITMQNEFFMMGLRRRAGVSLNEFSRRFGPDALRGFAQSLEQLEQSGLLNREGDMVAPTERGVWMADSVAEQLMRTED